MWKKPWKAYAVSFFDTMWDTFPEDTEKLMVTTIMWYKEGRGLQHEFLVVSVSKGSALLWIDRQPDSEANLNEVKMTSYPLSKGMVEVVDTVLPITSTTLHDIVATTHAIMTYKFSEIPLLELGQIVKIVSQFQSSYVLTNTSDGRQWV